MRGRKPVPVELKIIRGSRKMSRQTTPHAPEPAGRPPEPPGWLTDAQRALWSAAIATAPAGVLTGLDQSVLAAWVVAIDTHRQAAEVIAREGLFVKSPSGYEQQHPAVAVMNKQTTLLLRAAEQLGFSPSSRQRIRVAPAEGEPVDERWNRFLK